jgi:hypothetical protein
MYGSQTTWQNMPPEDESRRPRDGRILPPASFNSEAKKDDGGNRSSRKHCADDRLCEFSPLHSLYFSLEVAPSHLFYQVRA